MRRAMLVCAVLAAISPTYAGAADRVWRMSVLALADDGSTRLTDKELKKRSQSPLSQQCSAVRLEMD